MMNMRYTAPPLYTSTVMVRAVLAVVAILAAAVIVATLAVAVPALSSAASVTMQGDQLCVRTTCIDHALRVTTYQTQPDLPSAPPSALYTGRCSSTCPSSSIDASAKDKGRVSSGVVSRPVTVSVAEPARATGVVRYSIGDGSHA